MKTSGCADSGYSVRTVEELGEEYRTLSKPYWLALAVVSLVGVTGMLTAFFVHGIFWQNATVAVFFCSCMLSGMFIITRLPMPSQYEFVGTKEMVSMGEKLKSYPELREEFCRILRVRPVLTKYEYVHFASLIADKEEDTEKLATKEAWALMQERLCCDDKVES